MNRTKIYIGILCSLLLCWTVTNAQKSDLKHFPKEASPRIVGENVANRYLSFGFRNFGDIYAAPANEITYPEVCTWFGALRFAEITKNKKLASRLEDRFLPLLGKDKKLTPKPDHVDHTVFGSIPLELFMHTKNKCYLHYGIYYADEQWTLPAKASDEQKQLIERGLTWQTRYWIDDMFMITQVQTQAYLATGNPEYINRAAREMVIYLDKIQTKNGLFYHAESAPFYWGRGNGWMAAGMTNLLRYLPTENPNYDRIMQAYRLMMSTLKTYQSASGMWRQLVDDSQAWKETSCTGMFTYAMITGVKKGWLNAAEYAPVARKGWLALVSHIDENSDVNDVCEGTNISNSRQFYLDRGRKLGDMHGQAPVLWCAYALCE
ncbi:MAG: glycoside hydrolase family 88 protein [Prolixibacteraceae bacterium]|nr:glycoside hydrolase family 88 protein [Prolixibacteraceae bacterium]